MIGINRHAQPWFHQYALSTALVATDSVDDRVQPVVVGSEPLTVCLPVDGADSNLPISSAGLREDVSAQVLQANHVMAVLAMAEMTIKQSSMFR